MQVKHNALKVLISGVSIWWANIHNSVISCYRVAIFWSKDYHLMLLLPSRDENYNYKPMAFDDVTIEQSGDITLTDLVDVTE